MRTALAVALVLATAPASAGPVCHFTEECYMTLDCEATDWEVTVDTDAGVLSTMVEDLEILHVEAGAATQIVARGMGSLNLLTIGPATSVMSVHIGAGPAAIAYYGECRE
jgi:hypothetical protein